MVGQGEQAHAGGTDARAEHGDALRIAPEVADVLADPAQGLDLVQQAIVALGGLVTCAQEAWKRSRRESVTPIGQQKDEQQQFLPCGPLFCCNFEAKYGLSK